MQIDCTLSFFIVQECVKEKLRLLQEFLLSDTQDQLKILEDKLKSSELSTVSLLCPFNSLI